jgi:Rrf2 family iron-sulfur cluster assembly transcriptional regulator
MFSKTCEYAIKMMIFLAAKQEGVRVGLEEIAQAIDSPKAFTAKILQQLARAGLLDSLRGRTGGFTLPDRHSITLADIVRAIDGDKVMYGCVLGFKACSEARPCPAHFKFKSVRDHLSGTLLTTSIDELRGVVTDKSGYLTE